MEPSYHAGETSITPHHCESHCGFFDKSVPAIRSIIKTKPHSLDCGSVDPIIAESSFSGAASFPLPAPLSAAQTLASSKSDLDLKESSLLRNEAPEDSVPLDMEEVKMQSYIINLTHPTRQ